MLKDSSWQWDRHGLRLQDLSKFEETTLVLDFLENSSLLRNWVSHCYYLRKKNEVPTPGDSHYFAAILALQPVVEVLLSRPSVDVNRIGGGYNTALQAASQNSFIEIIKLLIGAGADVNIQGGIYHIALNAASIAGNAEIAKIVIEASANVNLQGGPFSTALLTASVYRHIEIVKLLIRAGADVNIRDERGIDALQIEAYYSRVDNVRQLLKAGADVNMQGKRWQTALEAALSSDKNWNQIPDIVYMLLEAGANVNDLTTIDGMPRLQRNYRWNLSMRHCKLETGGEVANEHLNATYDWRTER